MRGVRNYREPWNPDADLVFFRRVRNGGSEPYRIGDPLTPELREHLGEHRVKLWFEAGYFGDPSYATGKILKAIQERRAELGSEPQPLQDTTAEDVQIVRHGGPWYEVLLGEESFGKVRGRPAAEVLASRVRDFEALRVEGLSDTEARTAAWSSRPES